MTGNVVTFPKPRRKRKPATSGRSSGRSIGCPRRMSWPRCGSMRKAERLIEAGGGEAAIAELVMVGALVCRAFENMGIPRDQDHVVDARRKR